MHPHVILISMPKAPSEPGELVRRMSAELSAYMAELDADRMTPATAAALFRAFAELIRLSGAGEMLVASKATEAPDWKEGGHRSAAAWMAATSGSGLGEAISRLETAERLGSLDATAQALRSGALSTQKAKEIAAVAVTTPEVEAELLSVAETGSMKTLKEYCRRVHAQRGSAADENARVAAIHDSRYFRHGTDPDGAFKGTFKLTPDHGALLLTSLDARADALSTMPARTRSTTPPPAMQPMPSSTW